MCGRALHTTSTTCLVISFEMDDTMLTSGRKFYKLQTLLATLVADVPSCLVQHWVFS